MMRWRRGFRRTSGRPDLPGLREAMAGPRDLQIGHGSVAGFLTVPKQDNREYPPVVFQRVRKSI